MTCFYLRLFVPHLPLICAPNTVCNVVEHTHFRSTTLQSTCHVSVVKNASPSFFLRSSFQNLHCIKALPMNVAGDIFDYGRGDWSRVSGESPEKSHVDDTYDYPEDVYDEEYVEKERRRKIGQANRGRVAWNKGIPHSAETRERIRQRTKEALNDPKIRRKLSELPRFRSLQTRAKIGATQRKKWAKRLKVKRQKQKFFQQWRESISEAAKKGGSGEEELDWDSYDKIERELTLRHIQQVVEEEQAIEISRIKIEQAARARVEMMAQKRKEREEEEAQRRKEREEREKIFAQKRKEREEKAKTRVVKKRPRKTKEEKEELAAAQEIKLKEKLQELREKKAINGPGNTLVPRIPALEKLDLELVKKEKMRKEVSLADQLQAAKNKRAEYVGIDSSAAVSGNDPSHQRPKKEAQFSTS